MQQDAFTGAKLLLYVGASLLVIRRDHTPGIPFPGFLDFPGGGREGGEGPEDCVLRETWEEVGLSLDPVQLVWRSPHEPGGGPRSWFFAAHLDDSVVQDVRFGGEGTGWSLMPPDEYLDRGDAIPHFQLMLRRYVATREG
ncbi:NUDIX domain-containing protein [Puniceibacterium sediminis]|uniref:8-oxo-dGTP diphosphatase n=1 Tax=Puniceibacterium sediminis TaxID=1608407 RepID=A0A238WTG0_9RHOB|nr:NUDIX domain-containing protein [Puniceibacterium sediminis]SNR48939.1 8-oxo-dGTP diphosphatase [Puniceibacterium sediminis]